MDDLRQVGSFSDLSNAPRDGRLVIGRDADGEMWLMRWRSRDLILKEDGPDDQRPAYWARWHSDETIGPVEWAATELRMEDVMDRG